MGNVFNYGEKGLAGGDFVAVLIAPTDQCLGLTFPGQATASNPLASPGRGEVSPGSGSSPGLEGSAQGRWGWGTQRQPPPPAPAPG